MSFPGLRASCLQGAASIQQKSHVTCEVGQVGSQAPEFDFQDFVGAAVVTEHRMEASRVTTGEG